MRRKHHNELAISKARLDQFLAINRFVEYEFNRTNMLALLRSTAQSTTEINRVLDLGFSGGMWPVANCIDHQRMFGRDRKPLLAVLNPYFIRNEDWDFLLPLMNYTAGVKNTLTMYKC